MTLDEARGIGRDGPVRREVRRPRARRRRSATGPASCAAARTSPRSASSAWSSCSPSPRSAPACAGSRRSSASTPTASSPARRLLVCQLSDLLKGRRRSSPTASPSCSPAQGRREGDRSGRRRCSSPPPVSSRPPATSAACLRQPRARRGRRRRRAAQLVLDVRGRLATTGPSARFDGGRGQRPPARHRATNEAARERGLKAGAFAAHRRPVSAAVAAARTTSPRAAAPTSEVAATLGRREQQCRGGA